MRTFGADVSHWEGDINWLQGVDYLPFVYYKATDGIAGIDIQFLGNKAECFTVGIPNAPYHWWQETQDPIAQADHFVDTVMPGYKRLIVDVEPKEYVANMLYKLKLLLARIEERTGIIPAIYTSAYYWNTFIQSPYLTRHPLLAAHYAYAGEPDLPAGATSWTIWQFTDKFWFWGCDATADGNWFNGDLDTCREWFGNYHPYDPPPPEQGFHYKSLYHGLRIRSGPNIAYPEVGHLEAGEIVDAQDFSGQDVWMKHSRGWSAVKWYGYQYMTKA